MANCEHGYAEGACTVCEMARLRKENDILRGIAAKVMPCHYCGVDSIGKCPHGFPGCSLADDMMAGDECMSAEIQKLRREVKNANEIADAAGKGAQLGPIIGAQTILEQELKIKVLERNLAMRKHGEVAEELEKNMTDVKVTPEGCLICPKCGECNLHHGRVEIFNRKEEDAPVGVHALVSGTGARINLEGSMAENPSTRRSGLVIYFMCEHCHGEDDGFPMALAIAQHKGVTYVEWRSR